MTRPYVGEVIATSPYRGEFFLLHIVVADAVDPALVLRVSQQWLAGRARVSRNTVAKFLQRAVGDGVLEVAGTGPRGAVDYRLVLPTCADLSTSNGSDPRSSEHVTRADASTSPAHDPRTTRADVSFSRARPAHMVRDTTASVSTDNRRARTRVREATAGSTADAAGRRPTREQPRSEAYHLGERPWRDADGFWRGLDAEAATEIDPELRRLLGWDDDTGERGNP